MCNSVKQSKICGQLDASGMVTRIPDRTAESCPFASL
jgi:uncharacterized protein YfaQ (DUF2300 family)